jgi:hypothetical protein
VRTSPCPLLRKEKRKSKISVAKKYFYDILIEEKSLKY